MEVWAGRQAEAAAVEIEGRKKVKETDRALHGRHFL